jgi:RsiW-degrading membrane proteinase PrsW (M82 family)
MPIDVALDWPSALPVNPRQEHVMDVKTLLIVVLAIGVAVLGYLYYESQQNKVRVDLPGVKIEAN